MNNIKTYRITAPDFDHAEVTLEVDHDVLTPALATEINQFWGGAMHRMTEEGGNAARTAIRLFGACAIAYFLGDGGADIVAHRLADSEHWTRTVLDAQPEGWPDYESLGIRIKGAAINSSGFYEVELEVLP